MSIVQNDTSEIKFDMIDATTGDPASGKTVSGQWGKPSGALVACAGSFREIGGGAYGYTPVAGNVDTLGDVVFIPTASGCKTIVRGDRVVQAGPVASDYTQARAALLDHLDANVSSVPTAVQNADAFLARNQKGGSNGPSGQTVADALAGGLLDFTITNGTMTVKNGDGTTAFTRTLTRDQTLLLGALLGSF